MRCLFFGGCSVYALHRALPVPLQLAAAGVLGTIGWSLVGPHNFIGVIAVALAIVLAVAALEPLLGHHANRFGWIGDNSYGVYLWHIPIQILLLLLVSDRSVFDAPWMLGVFVLGTMLLARLSFLGFERPQRAWWQAQLKAPNAGTD